MIVLNLNESNLHELEMLKTAESNSVNLSCENATHETIMSIVNLLKDFGSALNRLRLELKFPSDPYHHDLKEFDFARNCPHLEILYLTSCVVNESVLKHPTLIRLILQKSWLHTNNMVQIGVDGNSALQYLELDDCNWCNEEKESVMKLTVGEKSMLKRIMYSLDEDYAECSVNNFEIYGLPQLDIVHIKVHMNFSLKFIGKLPTLSRIITRSGRYASHHLDFTKVEDGSSKYLTNLRNGKGKCFGHVYVFMGQDEYFDQDKLKTLIEVLGGKIQSTIDENVNHVCLFGDYYKEWKSKKPSIDELVVLKSLKKNKQKIDVMDKESILDDFRDWY